ncbi:QRFPR [Branchiostoma lanceolatum]|uniref:QRFPR protein n=1 Tax=Branchiostoma lanceolatum TaxID=7740 RepID=A0A8K0EC89_BRALA|nr:QRFPR [Branchiostoma lanceolatum]
MEEESNDTFFEFTNETVYYDNESFPNDTFYANATYPPYLGAYTILFMLEFSVPVLTVATLTVLLGTTGNVLVIFSVCRYRRLRSSISFYLVSLATADLLLCCVFTPLKTAEYFLPEWPFGAVMCKAVAFIQLLAMSSSVLTLTAIAYERNYIIVYPMKAKSACTMSRTRRVIALIWITSLILSAPVLYGQQLKRWDWPVYTVYHCQKVWPGPLYSRLYAIYVAIFLFFIPVIVMVTAYGRASFELWASEEVVLIPLRPLQVTKSTPNSSGRGDTRDFQRTHLSTISPFSGKFSRKNSKLEKQQVMKMLLMVVFLYTMCWAPILLLNMLIEFSAINPNTEQVWALKTTFELLVYINSCVNPICYAFMSRHFRDGFRKACLSCFCGRRLALKLQLQGRPHLKYQNSGATSSTGSETFHSF